MVGGAVVLWGASGHARVVADAAKLAGVVSLAGFLDDDVERKGDAFAGASILGGRAELAEILAGGVSRIHVAVGHCAARQRLADLALAEGFSLETIVHPRASMASDARVGRGTFAAAGAIVNAAASVGENVILNTGCSVDHECVIGDGAHIGPGARLGGLAQVGQGTWVGIGATIADRVRIGERSIIGAGAVVVRDVPAGVVAYGVPAVVMRNRRPNE